MLWGRDGGRNRELEERKQGLWEGNGKEAGRGVAHVMKERGRVGNRAGEGVQQLGKLGMGVSFTEKETEVRMKHNFTW